MSEPKLKPCPLCGRKAHFANPVRSVWNIGCGDDEDFTDTCGLVLFGFSKQTKKDLAEKWNKRIAGDTVTPKPESP